ncbi:uncharacterized protein ASCRUDRAFT_69042 [Ascoidea rubescens DSM 1968]|uniref:Uncharacterized protein n=1 Tax=Ascoidea rubescens DSM 1968 TaxID=1344418 RepID=A0A1D2VKT8_9ASCO|nr:hypothetical protein ASCRUDRAFT_69042 [Ascoidea rubescens DSM 1968]ODV62219.1 hypothetical protein ASCRUDRAFT_69042 [Ascoidea rubescens DSM 1968]
MRKSNSNSEININSKINKRKYVSSKNCITREKLGKRQSDSRLSLPALAKILNLENNQEEAGKREKYILSILKNDIGFQLGNKTWVRDTPLQERERILDELYHKVKSVYDYDKELLEVIVRRASYYMMQGRLRRERRAAAKLRKQK